MSGSSGAPGEQGNTTGERGEKQGSGAGPDWLDQELRKITEGGEGEARFREPTAEERGKLAEQARKKQEADARKFAQLEKETQKQSQKLQKKAFKEQRKARRRARWRRGLRRTAWGVSAVVLVGACVFAYTRFGHSAGGPNDTQVVTNGAVPPTTAKQPSPLTESGPPADPFQGSPADKWANGAAGIVIPAAQAHGEYPAAKVESAYQTTKKLLIAAALDKQALDGGAPTSFADLLTQEQRDQFTSQLDKIGLRKDGSSFSSRGLIVQFAPGTATFIGSGIKVHGTMSAAASKDNGYPILRVNVDYIVVYAVEPPRAPADWMRVVAQFDGSVEFGDWNEADTPFEPWWGFGPAVAGARCDTKDGFVHPDYPSGPPDTAIANGPAVNPYAFGEPGKTDACQPTTGT
jgi:hypothetical protein